jgi:hypothetical protein
MAVRARIQPFLIHDILHTVNDPCSNAVLEQACNLKPALGRLNGFSAFRRGAIRKYKPVTAWLTRWIFWLFK